MIPGADESYLLQQINCDDPQQAEYAFRMFYKAYSGHVLAYCRHMLPQNARFFPQDILQQTFINFFKAVKAGMTIQNPAAFLMTTARNLCFNEINRTKIPDMDVHMLELPASPPRGGNYDQKQLLELIYSAIDRLPEDDRELILLREQMGYSFAEISVITGLSEISARQRAHRARRFLREMLAPYIEDLEKNLRDTL
jgi:RNA polymerase sigma-70 factor (ECF subfamily)